MICEIKKSSGSVTGPEFFLFAKPFKFPLSITLIFTSLNLLNPVAEKVWPYDCYVGNELPPILVNALTVRIHILSVLTLQYM